MNRILIITILVSCLNASDSIAQMGHGMMRHMESETEHRHMMEHSRMMDRMQETILDMSGIMRRMSEMAGNISNVSRDMSGDKMHEMAAIMRDLCIDINKMAEMMDRGMVTEGEMDDMYDRMTEMQKKMSEMGIKK